MSLLASRVLMKSFDGANFRKTRRRQRVNSMRLISQKLLSPGKMALQMFGYGDISLSFELAC